MEKQDHHIIPFAEDNAGNLCTVPGSAVALRFKKKQPDGKAGRPSNVCLNGKQFELTLPVEASAIAVLSDGEYIADAYDVHGKRVGPRILFSIEHLAGPGQTQTTLAEPTGVVRELIEMNKRLQAQTEMLHETLIKTVHQVTVALDKMTTAQVQLTKHLAPVVEAAAATVTAARGRGFASIADELQAVMDMMPENGNSLETVLSSPVVVGAAGMLQKFMSEAAKNAAASAAGVGGHSDTEAARQARRFHKLQAERERREAQQGA